MTYDGNTNTSGSPPTDVLSPYDAGSSVTILGNTGSLARTGYTFTGWNTAADGSGTHYSPTNTFTINADTILYAQWEYFVTYYGNTNTSGSPPVDVLSPYDAGSSVSVMGNTGLLEKDGYTFAGWNTAADGSGTSYSPFATFTIEAITPMYAQWTLLPHACFLEGTKILCFESNEEVYRPIESLRKGDLVKTIYNGYMPICMMGTSPIYNLGNDYRVVNRMYKCSREKYPTLFEDLYMTGCHSILVPSMTDDQWENTKAVNGNIYVTDNHFRLIACADEKAEPFNNEGFMNIYHIALDHHDICMNYGIYANGLLVESCSIEYLIKYSKLKILGEEDCAVSENVDKVLIRDLVSTY